jgi:hypothetical protein
MATIALISLGWILFRANSLSQANQMLLAVASPKSYAVHFLSASLYFLVGSLAAGYAVVLAVAGVLERRANNSEGQPQSGAVAFLARWRWFWIPALYALAMLLLLMTTLTQSGGAAQLMYRGF